MAIWIVIPVKPFDEGKARLAGVLSPDARRRLNLDMFERTLRIVSIAQKTQRLLVVSRSNEALQIAAGMGAVVLPETASSDLNSALTQAANALIDTDASGVLSLSADLPLLEPTDLHLILDEEATDRRITIAPDRERLGTNALSITPPLAIPYRYGEDSFAAHQALARSTNLAIGYAETPGLAFDIDTPEDLEAARSLGAISGDTLVQRGPI